jgi:hypothetical protein
MARVGLPPATDFLNPLFCSPNYGNPSPTKGKELEMSYQSEILDCLTRSAEVSTTNLMRRLRQQLRHMVPLEAIQADCEHLANAGKLAVRVKGCGKYWRLNAA